MSFELDPQNYGQQSHYASSYDDYSENPEVYEYQDHYDQTDSYQRPNSVDNYQHMSHLEFQNQRTISSKSRPQSHRSLQSSNALAPLSIAELQQQYEYRSHRERLARLTSARPRKPTFTENSMMKLTTQLRNNKATVPPSEKWRQIQIEHVNKCMAQRLVDTHNSHNKPSTDAPWRKDPQNPHKVIAEVSKRNTEFQREMKARDIDLANFHFASRLVGIKGQCDVASHAKHREEHERLRRALSKHRNIKQRSDQFRVMNGDASIKAAQDAKVAAYKSKCREKDRDAEKIEKKLQRMRSNINNQQQQHYNNNQQQPPQLQPQPQPRQPQQQQRPLYANLSLMPQSNGEFILKPPQHGDINSQRNSHSQSQARIDDKSPDNATHQGVLFDTSSADVLLNSNPRIPFVREETRAVVNKHDNKKKTVDKTPYWVELLEASNEAMEVRPLKLTPEGYKNVNSRFCLNRK